MSDVKVDHVFCVGPLHADGKGVAWVEGEGHEAAGGRGRVFALETRVDFELEQP